jgi:hypothetical protein
MKSPDFMMKEAHPLCKASLERIAALTFWLVAQRLP